MSRFLEALRSGKVILMDGAMGTELMHRRGVLERTEEEANISRPELVEAVHRAYLGAGAQCLLTNTFLAHVKAGSPEGGIVPRDLPVVCQRGEFLARSAGEEEHFVLGDIGPPLDLWQAETAEDRIRAAATSCLQLADWLVRCDAILVETQPSLEVVGAILELARRPPHRPPWIVSFAFSSPEGQPVCNGCAPEIVAEFVSDHRNQFVALGVNCGRDIGMDEIIDIVRRYRQVTDLPLLARPNAGTPKRAGNEWVYPETPARMATRLPELIDAGATLIGGCCGTTPEHIAAFREVIDRLGVGWKP